MTRQTKTRHGETLSDWDFFCPKYTGDYLATILSLGCSKWDGSLSSLYSLWPHNKQITAASSLRFLQPQSTAAGSWGMKSVHNRELVCILACENKEKGSQDGVLHQIALQSKWFIRCKYLWEMRSPCCLYLFDYFLNPFITM